MENLIISPKDKGSKQEEPALLFVQLIPFLVGSRVLLAGDVPDSPLDVGVGVSLDKGVHRTNLAGAIVAFGMIRVRPRRFQVAHSHRRDGIVLQRGERPHQGGRRSVTASANVLGEVCSFARAYTRRKEATSVLCTRDYNIVLTAVIQDEHPGRRGASDPKGQQHGKG